MESQTQSLFLKLNCLFLFYVQVVLLKSLETSGSKGFRSWKGHDESYLLSGLIGMCSDFGFLMFDKKLSKSVPVGIWQYS